MTQPEDEFIPPAPSPPSRRRRPERVRLGPFLISSGMVAWGGSLLAHGAVAVAAVVFVRTHLRNTPPQVRFAFGGGSEGSLVAAADSPDAAMPDAGGAVPRPTTPMAMPQTLAQAADRSDAAASRALETAAFSPAPSPGPDPSQQQMPSDWAAASSGDTAGPLPRVPRAANSGASMNASAASGTAPSALHSGAASGSRGSAQSSPGSGTVGVPAGLLDRSLPKPIYPPDSLRKGEQGMVRLSVDVNADGTIGQIRVVEDPGHPRLVAAAIAAVRQAHFSPELRDGKPVAAVVVIPFPFTIR